MTGASRYFKEGYMPLAMNEYGGISWQGTRLDDFWMWNGQYNECGDGTRTIQTVRVAELREAAVRYWRDGWLPVKPVDREFVRRMEGELRNHQGLRRAGVVFPEGDFLDLPGPVPEDGPEGL